MTVKTLTINIIQPRVATGHDQSSTTELFFFTDSDKIVYVGTDEKDYNYNGYFTLFAKVIVTRPWLMAGNWAECLSDMIHIAEKKLVEEKICTKNDWGVLFVA